MLNYLQYLLTYLLYVELASKASQRLLAWYTYSVLGVAVKPVLLAYVLTPLMKTTANFQRCMPLHAHMCRVHACTR